MHWQEPEKLQLSQNLTVICNAPCKVQVLLNIGRPMAFSPKHTGEREWCYTYKYTHFFMPCTINKIFTTTIHAHKLDHLEHSIVQPLSPNRPASFPAIKSRHIQV